MTARSSFAIVTSCWSAVLPPAFVRVGISRSPPRGQRGYRRYLRLNPGPWFRSVPDDAFIRLYRDEVLGKLDPHQVVRDLAVLSGGRTVALLCWERPGERWCHRGLVAWWLHHHTALEVAEFGHKGIGIHHPMLPQTQIDLLRP